MPISKIEIGKPNWGDDVNDNFKTLQDEKTDIPETFEPGNFLSFSADGNIKDSGESTDTLLSGGRSIVPCEHVRNPETKTHVLTQTYPDQSLPESGVIPVSFIPTADFQAGDKFSFAGHEFTPQYENTTLAVADGAFRSGVAITINFQILPGGG